MKSIKVRLVKYKLNTGETEYLLTDLSSGDFNTDEIGELYYERWSIEFFI